MTRKPSWRRYMSTRSAMFGSSSMTTIVGDSFIDTRLWSRRDRARPGTPDEVGDACTIWRVAESCERSVSERSERTVLDEIVAAHRAADAADRRPVDEVVAEAGAAAGAVRDFAGALVARGGLAGIAR